MDFENIGQLKSEHFTDPQKTQNINKIIDPLV